MNNLFSLKSQPCRFLGSALVAVSFLLLGCAIASDEEQSRDDKKVSATSPTAKFNLETDENADEKLFLIRNLEAIYNRWPSEFNDQKRIGLEVHHLRLELARYCEYVIQKKLDQTIVAMYQDALQQMDAYVALLLDLKILDQEQHEQLNSQVGEGLVSTIASGISVAWETKGDLAIRAAAASGAMVMSGLSEYHEYQELTEVQELKNAQRFNQYLTVRARIIGRTEARAVALAEKYQWNRTEVGFESEDGNENLESAEVFAALNRELLTLRKRDPFVHAASGAMQRNAEYSGDEEFVRGMREAADSYISAARLIPEGQFHDAMRGRFLSSAAGCLSDATKREGTVSSMPLEVATAALELSPRNRTASYVKARAFATAGKFSEAIALMKKTAPFFADSGEFHLNFAEFELAVGSSSSALEHIQTALAIGRSDVEPIRSDTRFAPLKNRNPVEFAQALAPKWGLSISYGTFWNDAILSNPNKYWVTDLFVNAEWVTTEGSSHREILYASSLAPMSKSTLEGAFDFASQDEKKSFTGSIAAFQSRSFQEMKRQDYAGRRFSGWLTTAETDASDVEETVLVRATISEDSPPVIQFTTDNESFAFVLEEEGTGFINLTPRSNTEISPTRLWLDGNGRALLCKIQTSDRIKAVWLEQDN